MFEKPLSGSISPSGTYMVGIYDDVLNIINFKRIALPKTAPNSIKNAMQHYLLDNIREATNIHIVACISIEEYLSAGIPDKEKEDIEKALEMLNNWNEKQKKPADSYSAALTTLLEQVGLMDDFNDRFRELKEKALAILEIE